MLSRSRGRARNAPASDLPFQVAEPKLPELQRERRWYLPRTFDAFRFGPFRWFMGAMIWWNAAMSMQMLVRGYLVYQMTDSFAALGVVSLGLAIPMLLVSPIGGVVADRTSRRAVLQLGQLLSVVIAAVVATLLFIDILVFWHLVVASVAHGLIVAVVMPSRQALLPDVVGVTRLMNAIPLQAAGLNLMQILAPALGGYMIDWTSAAWVYVFIAALAAMSVLMLFFVKSRSPEELAANRNGGPAGGREPARDPFSDGRGPPSRGSAIEDLSGGVEYLRRDRTVFSILSFSFLATLLGMPIRLLLPGYVGAVFSDSGSTLGLLQMGMGVGALIGALSLASLRLTRHRGLVLAANSMLIGIALIAFSMTGVIWLAWLGLLVVGIGSTGRQAMSQVLVQEYVEDDYRGRVMSIFMMQASLMSIGAFGVSLYMGKVGPEFAIGSTGAVLIMATIAFLILVPRFRRLA